MEWLKCDEVEPPKHKRVLCVQYGSDVAIGLTIEPIGGEDKEDYRRRLMKAASEKIERSKYEEKSVEIGFISDDGWYSDDGFPMIIKPTLWAEIPTAPDYGDITNEVQ